MIGVITKMVTNTLQEERLFNPFVKEGDELATVRLDSGEIVGAQYSVAQGKCCKIGKRVIVRLFGCYFSL